MNEKESRMREQRTIEATKKGYMGISGQFGTIVKYLGEPIEIHADDGVLRDSNYLPDFDIQPETEEFPTTYMPFWGLEYGINGNAVELDEPESLEWRKRDYNRKVVTPLNVGMYFYGISSGINLEIRYDAEYVEFGNMTKNRMTVKYDGNVVYSEIGGELFAFSPGPWEEKVKILFNKAKDRERTHLSKEKAKRSLIIKKEKEGWLQSLKKLWGF